MVAPALHTGGLGWAAFPVTSSLFPSFLRKGKLDRGQRPGFRAGLCGPGLSGAGGKARWALSRWALPRPHRPSLSLSSRADDTACGRPSPTANLTGVVRTAPGAGGTRSPAASSRLVLSPCSGAVLMTPVRAVHCLLAPSPPSNAPRLPLPSSTPAHCPPAGHTPLQTCLQTPRLARPPSSYAWWGLPDLWALLHASLGSSAHQVPTRAPSSDRALGGPDLLPTLSPVPDPSGTPVLPAWPGPGSARHPCLCPLGLRPPPAFCPLCQARGTYRCARLARDMSPHSRTLTRGRPSSVAGMPSQACNQPLSTEQGRAWHMQVCGHGLTATPAAGLPSPEVVWPGAGGWWAPASWLAPWSSRGSGGHRIRCLPRGLT